MNEESQRAVLQAKLTASGFCCKILFENFGVLSGALATSDIAGNAYTICRSNMRPEYFVTGGDRTIKIWQFNAGSKKMHGTDAKLGKLRRVITCLVVDSKDNFAYCGTMSGDIIKLK